jgi:hypothetical protein
MTHRVFTAQIPGTRSTAFRTAWTLLFIASCLAGCRSAAPFSVNSQPDRQKATTASIERLLVHANIKDQFFSDDSYRGFEMGLTKGLADCGISSRVVPTDAERPDALSRIAEVPGQPSPSTAMTIRISDRQIILDPRANLHYGVLFFELKLFDMRSRDAIWVAKASFEIRPRELDVDSDLHAMRFAWLLLTTLQRDGMLNNCRVQEAYPGCLQERREALLQASGTTDKLERWRLFKSAPSCR